MDSYDLRKTDERVQHFPVVPQRMRVGEETGAETEEEDDCCTFQYVQIKIRSNYGNPNYTCLYRFQVHGEAQ